MGKTGYIVGGLVLAVIVGVATVGYISAYNKGNQMENNIIATYENNENVLAQYGQRVQEAAQVPGMMRDDLVAVTTEALAGRYGDNGSQAVFSWIQENYPGQLSPDLYTQLQRIIEAGRNEFRQAQTRLTDRKRQYREALGSFFGGTFLNLAGYPTINIGMKNGRVCSPQNDPTCVDDFPVITTARASDTFDSGVEDGPMELR